MKAEAITASFRWDSKNMRERGPKRKRKAAAAIGARGKEGHQVRTLIDILENDVDRVTLDTLIGLYPFGHYSEIALDKKIDEHKAGKYRWSKIY